MAINKDKIAELARDCHDKHTAQKALHKQYQKEETADLAAQHAIASVEYKRAKKLLDNVMADESVILVGDLPTRESTNEV